jgi:hypothetical protein
MWPQALFGFDFFISYARSDAAAYATKLAELLRAGRFRVFLDRSEFGAGPRFRSRLEKDLKASSTLILIVTSIFV